MKNLFRGLIGGMLAVAAMAFTVPTKAVVKQSAPTVSVRQGMSGIVIETRQGNMCDDHGTWYADFTPSDAAVGQGCDPAETLSVFASVTPSFVSATTSGVVVQTRPGPQCDDNGYLYENYTPEGADIGEACDGIPSVSAASLIAVASPFQR